MTESTKSDARLSIIHMLHQDIIQMKTYISFLIDSTKAQYM